MTLERIEQLAKWADEAEARCAAVPVSVMMEIHASQHRDTAVGLRLLAAIYPLLTVSITEDGQLGLWIIHPDAKLEVAEQTPALFLYPEDESEPWAGADGKLPTVDAFLEAWFAGRVPNLPKEDAC